MRSGYSSDASFFQCIYSKRKHLGAKDSPLQIKDSLKRNKETLLRFYFLNLLGPTPATLLKNLEKLSIEENSIFSAISLIESLVSFSNFLH